MKRIVPLLIVAVAVVAFLAKGFWWPAGYDGGRYLGYVEGETTLIAAPSAGRLVERPLSRGDSIKQGQLVFSLDPVTADAEVGRATATLAQTTAQYQDLLTGKREAEQNVVRAQRREAEAALANAEQDLDRATRLVSTGAGTRSRYDQAKSQVSQLQARVQSLVAQEAANDLGGRLGEREAAKAKVHDAEEALEQARQRRADIAPKAPADAQVENTFYEVGEWVGAGQPVVSLLEPGNIKLRFFVSEEDVARAQPGTTVGFHCDGCPADQTATITYVSPRAEFTPPVIYSESARKKLVFLVEARPTKPLAHLRPGLPVEVEPLKGANS